MAREIRSRLEEDGAFRLESRRRLAEEPWALHALGEVLPVAPTALAVAPMAIAGEMLDGEAVRARASRLGLTYRAAFAAVCAVEAAGDRALVHALEERECLFCEAVRVAPKLVVHADDCPRTQEPTP